MSIDPPDGKRIWAAQAKKSMQQARVKLKCMKKPVWKKEWNGSKTAKKTGGTILNAADNKEAGG